MKVKHLAWLVSALSIGSCLSAQASEKHISQAEHRLKTFEAKYGKNHQSYSRQLLSAAKIYHRSGQRKKAQDMFNQALILDRKKGVSAEVGTLTTWASFLMFTHHSYFPPEPGNAAQKYKFKAECKANHVKDLAEAKKLLLKAKGLSSKLSVNDPYKFTAQINLSSKEFGKSASAEGDELLAQLKAEAKSAKSRNTYLKLGSIFEQLANRELSNGKSSSDKAARIKLQALTMWNKLPKTDLGRITANRRAVTWFRRIGKQDLAKSQTNQLAKLLGTNDPEKLFPPRPPCPACGMG